MALLYFKAFHIIGFVSWFAGLFYWLRIFVYLAESQLESQPARDILFAQFVKMERRVYSIIVLPALWITLIGGIGMLWLNPGYLSLGWMQIKLVLVLGLIGFQAFAKTRIRAAEEGADLISGDRMRMLNEVPTLFLLVIVLLAVLRDALDALTAISILLGFMILLMIGIRYYKSYRIRNPKH